MKPWSQQQAAEATITPSVEQSKFSDCLALNLIGSHVLWTYRARTNLRHRICMLDLT